MGYQYEWLTVISRFTAVPLYCLFFELWKSNHLPVGTAVPFFVIRTINKRDLKLYGEQIILGYL